VEAFLFDDVKAVLGGIVVVYFALAWLARAMPHVGWLQAFRLPTVHLSEEEKARRRRSANRMAAIEMILAGLVLPLGYLALTVMMFHDLARPATFVVGACSLALIGVGTWILARNL
jgi:hypothetical protein